MLYKTAMGRAILLVLLLFSILAIRYLQPEMQALKNVVVVGGSYVGTVSRTVRSLAACSSVW